MIQIHRKLTGEELHIIRLSNNINPNHITKLIGISPNDLVQYESQTKTIPDDIYNKWIEVIVPYLH